MVTVRIQFRDLQDSSSLRVWILYENLWQVLHHHKEVSISLQDADKALNHLSFEVRRRFVKRAIRETRSIVEQHFMTDEIDIFTEDLARPNGR